ncbi:MAG: DNA polymerase [Syntrophobacteraceae bacterium]
MHQHSACTDRLFCFSLTGCPTRGNGGFNSFDFWSIILTSSRRIGYHRNLPVQVTAADAFKLPLIDISEKLNGLDARIVYTQHDEIIVKAGEDTADQVQAIVQESSEEAFTKIIPEVPFIVEPRIADSWNG